MNFARYWQNFSLLEKIWLGASIAIFLLALLLFISDSLLGFTRAVPAPGGTLKEGVVGQPRFLNPVLAPLNPVDQAVSSLIYPALFKPDANGRLQPYLAKDLTISDDLRTYELDLNPAAVWEDGQPITAQDVVFTIELIQDPNFNSPLLEIWQEVAVEATGEHSVRFRLPEPYAFFTENLTLGILPKHKWEEVSSDRFSLSPLNLNPLSGGPYRVERVDQRGGQVENLILRRQPNFWGQVALIETIQFVFYPNFSGLLTDLTNGKIDAVSNLPVQFYPEVQSQTRLQIHKPQQLLYYALFFNQDQKTAFESKTVRQALGLAIDRRKLVDEVWHNQAVLADSPLPAGAEYAVSVDPLEFDPQKAKKLLKQAGATDLEVELTVMTVPALEATAQFIKSSWEQIGVRVKVQAVPGENFETQVLRGRSYEVLLFGQALRSQPDLFSFWHSSQSAYPGLNLAGYESEKTDKILETIRQTKEPQLLQEEFAKLQEQIKEDLPVVFLLSPKMLYAIDKKVKGVELKTISQPNERFWNVQNWYINTQRVYDK